jgi:hypothetical protein
MQMVATIIRQGWYRPQLRRINNLKFLLIGIQHFVRDPKKMSESGDERAPANCLKNIKQRLPSFAYFTDDELNAIIAFIKYNRKKPDQQMTSVYGKTVIKSYPRLDPIFRPGCWIAMMTQIPASSDSGKTPMAEDYKLDLSRIAEVHLFLDLRGKIVQTAKQ